MSTWSQSLGERQRLLDGGVRALPKVLARGLYGEAALLTDTTRYIITWTLRALVQRVSIVAKYGLGYCSVVVAMR